MPFRSRSAVITGTVRFAYHDGRGRGCGEIVLTGVRVDGKPTGADLVCLCECATPGDLDGIRGRFAEISAGDFKVSNRKVAVMTGAVIEFIPF